MKKGRYFKLFPLLCAVMLPALGSRAQATLTDHMYAQLNSRTNGASCGSRGYIGGANTFATPPVINPDFWLKDVTNIEAQSLGMLSGGNFWVGHYLTAISPRHCLGVVHTGLVYTNSPSVWILPNGRLYTNQGIAYRTDGNDAVVVLMAQTNPFFCRIFPNATRKIGFWQTPWPQNSYPGFTNCSSPVFVRFHQGVGGIYYYTNYPWFEPTFISGSPCLGVFQGETNTPLFGDYLDGNGGGHGATTWPGGDQWIAGDSGGAAYGIVNNEAVFVCAASSAMGGLPPANKLDRLNAMMASLSTNNAAPVYSLSVYDLSGFPDVDANNVPVRRH